MVNVTAFRCSETVFVDVAADNVVDENVVDVVSNLVMEVAPNSVTVNTGSFLIIALRHIIRSFGVEDRFLELAILSELAIAQVNIEAVLSLIPVVRDGGVETFGLPFSIGGEGDSGHGFPFRVGGKTNGEVGKAIADFHGSDVSVGIDKGRSAPSDVR